MKLTIVVPSAQYLNSAGNRIRYQRLQGPLARLGCTLSVTSVDALDADGDMGRSDIFLLSKVQDARGLAFAHEARMRGARIGIDLFDDYFSQVDDARFAPQRLWLSRMARTADFFLCSTAHMKTVAKRYFPASVGHILNDPFEHFEADRLQTLLQRKRLHAQESGRIHVLWFGMGDNPNFPVGLYDLVSHGAELRSLTRGQYDVKLTVLTNARALDRTGLAMLRGLPFRPEIAEWTQERERTLLEESLASFLPVNAQRFSIAKSLNRAITALTGGTQVISAGYPLYAPLEEFLYRDGKTLVDDLDRDSLRVSPRSLAALGTRLHEISNPIVEAEALHAFLSAVTNGASRDQTAGGRLAILHGERSTGAIHKFAQQRRWLSLGSPYCPAGASYDAHLQVFGAARPAMRLTKNAGKLLPDHLARQVRQAKDAQNALVLELPVSAFGPELDILLTTLAAQESVAARMILQPRIIDATIKIYAEAFGPLQLIESELAPLLCQARELEDRTGGAA